ncbi:hypothetical protein RFI_18934 [Reticulomyxa filosa]|uniref:MalT-like TPR region domain-containing protein n=1 Tax=Reticulomyxa filosa TaxID=46433 RepID=X6MZ51_RETFI|nr:hypothetical protein RFI_18934 [Reticulomyxa filosa]|eukprot:ETO18340.1 hypothetical protein RFI_18934 [Reticulomyxa filosa]
MNLKQFAMSKMFLEMALTIVSPSHLQYSPICEQFATLLRKQGDWKESIEYSNKALQAARSQLGDGHIQLAHLYLGRACSEMELKEHDKAEQSARLALQIVEANGPSQSKQPHTSASLEWKDLKCSVLFVLGQALIELNRLSDAKLVFQNALTLASQLNDQSKQLLITDQLRDIELLQTTNSV